MVITKAKFWTKAVQGENVEHVKIAYKDGDSETVIHEQGPNAVGTEQFYQAFWNLPLYVCKICGLDESLKTGIVCKDVSINPSEDKEGNDTTEYKLLCTLKAGHANAALAVSIQHKFIPEGFAEAIDQLVDEAEKYVDGERNQTNAFDQKTEELKQDIDNSEAEQTDVFDSSENDDHEVQEDE